MKRFLSGLLIGSILMGLYTQTDKAVVRKEYLRRSAAVRRRESSLLKWKLQITKELDAVYEKQFNRTMAAYKARRVEDPALKRCRATTLNVIRYWKGCYKRVPKKFKPMYRFMCETLWCIQQEVDK